MKTLTMTVTSPAFADGDMIPAKYTCTGENISPPLSWGNVPEGTKSIAVIADDPDAPRGTWVHWVYYNIPASVTGLAENISRDARPGIGGEQGMTAFRRIGYGGPCPPSGIHRYYFKIYALDSLLRLEAGATKAQLLKAMEGHVLAQGTLMGRFSR